MCPLPTSFLLNIQSRVKQEVDMPQIQNCVTRYSSLYWCSVPNIRKLACVVLEKNVTNFLWRWQQRKTTTQDDGYWSLYVASSKAGRPHKYSWDEKVQSPTHIDHHKMKLFNIVCSYLFRAEQTIFHIWNCRCILCITNLLR